MLEARCRFLRDCSKRSLLAVRSESADVELVPWLSEGVNRVVVMHISTDCRPFALQCAAAFAPTAFFKPSGAC